MDQMFTERVKKVMILARDESQRLGHDYVGAEHVLLGIIKDGEGVANRVLAALGVAPVTITQALEDRVAHPGGQKEPTPFTPKVKRIKEPTPFTPKVKAIMDQAVSEAKDMEIRYVGTEHLLLALAKDRDSTSAQVLAPFGATYETIKASLLAIIGDRPTSS